MKTCDRVRRNRKTPPRSMRIEGGPVKTVKSIATGVAALTAIGGPAAGVASMAAPTGLHEVQLAAFEAPLPQDPPPPPPPPPGAPGQLPTADQLANLCNQVTDPGVNYREKANLVENGVSQNEGMVADHDLRKAYRNGNFPEQFNVTNIAPAGPNMAQADVGITGPKFAGPVNKHLVFVNQGGNWVLPARRRDRADPGGHRDELTDIGKPLPDRRIRVQAATVIDPHAPLVQGRMGVRRLTPQPIGSHSRRTVCSCRLHIGRP